MKALIAVAALSLFGLASVSQAADPVKPYPLETCLISGEKLGEMGAPVVFVYEGQEIKMCCSGCKKKFDKDPAKYLKDLDAAAKKAGKTAS
jgi:YHS domain-containing protein